MNMMILIQTRIVADMKSTQHNLIVTQPSLERLV